MKQIGTWHENALYIGFALALFLTPSIGTSQTTESAREPVEPPRGLSASDWAGIRAAYEEGRYAACPVPGGHRAANPRQGWRTLFDGRGFTVRPDSGAWSWGLELLGYGRVGAERAVIQPEGELVDGGRVTYRWDGALEEWYLNQARGLEHGYTLAEPPAGSQEAGGEVPLTFLLGVRGGLQAQVHEDGRGVRFLDDDGAALLTYRGLTVLDADGRALPARLERITAGLRLTVADGGARYPLTIDPLVQQAYLKASNTGQGDNFGEAVALAGDTVVVGAHNERSNATGVNGDQSDNSALGSGAAYVFVRNGSIWSQQAYLKASNTGTGDHFGQAVAVSGDTVVVGASGEASSATGVNGDQSNNSASRSGAAYVFVRSGTSWSQQAYLKASNTDVDDFFGHVVAVSGDTVVVGAHFESSAASGVNGDESDNSASRSGAAYVFVRSGTSWSQQVYLKASNTDANDNFGISVAVSGTTAVVGAFHEDSSATGVDGVQTDNSAGDSGAAYVFFRVGTSWSQQAYLKASNTQGGLWPNGDFFGVSVAISGNTIVVGASGEDSSATGVDGDQGDNGAPGSGAAYVFLRSGKTWSQQAYLKASNAGAGDVFGASVASSEDLVLVGAAGESSGSNGVNGDQGDDGVPSAGAAYFFVRNGTTWSQQAYLKASNPDADDWFGFAVALSGGKALVGAWKEDSAASGVNGDGSGNSSGDSGAAYVFEVLCPSLVPSTETIRMGSPPNPTALLPGQTYGPAIASAWDPVIDHTTFFPTATLDLLILTAAQTNLDLGPPLGTLLCDIFLPTPVVLGAAAGTPFSVSVPASCNLIGKSVCAQGLSTDGVASELTNALDLTIGTL